ncbi:hypothetical protein H5085_03475 [Pseudoalteromonas sp. SR43-6]|jgi:small-conductance mechanosensitive channel|uniref:Uncharacterized protein n=2 Tax=Pseudoalteromonas TaxID=53246 RepID=A0A7X9U2Z1_9GAMM|nr:MULTISPECIES: hypothetical protein [Pseudoalteromonas]MBB1287471.1 hypothetical protein [Pseudoalteromonas sp. SR41-5]MBB1373399.1 hypothetical protein [Pseudoalteromonas sp. SR43-6]MBB1402726.1 hypothetical protein [Pseudoalteromonas sp. SG45-1]MBB1412112.1 hypothetical protein [Pseudoalteromonas sp. SG43-8]MBG9990496.1 hypothetical protein [Pseudoalteromonas sp. NZS37]|tara:strand:- start:166 stop:582 length:417 start_codon:yes stop_codon:yes gene_type:complete
MAQWHDEKTKIKDIFDAIRNFGLVGLIFYTSTISFLRANSSESLSYIYLSISIILLLLSFYLYYLNISSFYKTVKREYKANNVGHLFYILMPAFMLVLSIQVYILTTVEIKLKDGRNLSELTIKDILNFDNKEISSRE